MSKRNTSHVVLGENCMRCMACGASHPLRFPLSMREFRRKVDAWIALHGGCDLAQKEAAGG